MFLLDTMVLSESFKRQQTPGVVRWLSETEEDGLFVSVMTSGEIEAGIEKKRQEDDAAYARIEAWLNETRADYRARTLPVTADIALRWGRLTSRLKRRDMDILIAATALEHDLTVVTRNVRHFEPTGVKLFNPYEA